MNFGFLIAVGCILFVVELYRSSLLQLRKNERERELIMKELEHRGKNTYAVMMRSSKKHSRINQN